jgi:hypothetical protein
MTPRQAVFQELVEILHEAKSTPCSDCGIAYPIHVMQLDHRPDSGKLFHCSDPLWGKPSPGLDRAVVIHGTVKAALLAEIAKCDPVCGNCHAERTFRRRRAEKRYAPPEWCIHYDA